MKPDQNPERKGDQQAQGAPDQRHVGILSLRARVVAGRRRIVSFAGLQSALRQAIVGIGAHDGRLLHFRSLGNRRADGAPIVQINNPADPRRRIGDLGVLSKQIL
jgi:hypothetical protein